MLKSMTGYGEAAAESDRFVLSIELRSVNNRFLKISTKISEEISFVQNALEERIRESVNRGSVYVAVRFQPLEISELYEVDQPLLEKYLRSVESLSKKLGRDEAVPLGSLVGLPGVVRSQENLIPEREGLLPFTLDVLGKAIESMTEMRRREGANLETELRDRTKLLGELLKKIEAQAPRAIEEHHQRLDQRVRDLLGDQQSALQPEDLLKEMAILAERADIAEEITRMHSHIEQFAESLDSDQPIGRKLEFIVQEMFREANTMGSKSSNSELIKPIVEMKSEIERLKEQVANIE